jgi:hypothetical protein
MIKIAPFTNAVFVEELDYVLTSIESAIIDLKNRIPGETYSNRGGWQSKSYTRYEKPFMTGLIEGLAQMYDTECEIEQVENEITEISHIVYKVTLK